MFKQIFTLFLIIATIQIVNLSSIAKTGEEISDKQISLSSIGILNIGSPLKETEKLAKQFGFKIKPDKYGYNLLDKDNKLLATFKVFHSQPKTKPIRYIYTNNPYFEIIPGVSLVDSKVKKLSEYFEKVTIIKVPDKNDPYELLTFSNWPFAKENVYKSYLVNYKVKLRKYYDEYGKLTPVGKYPNEFYLYSTQYIPDATVESIEIDAIEPKIQINMPE